MRVLIAGGGTGGHLFPGIALAEEFMRRDPKSVCVFVGTKGRIESKVVPRAGFELRIIDVKGLKGKSPRDKINNLFLIPGSLYQSALIVREHKPELVIGMGGYASVPVIFAVLLTGIKTAICEQNTIPGTSNRVLARFVNRIFVSFAETKYFPSMKKTRFTGNPVRRELIESFPKRKAQNGKFTILLLGGSQGAHSMNENMLAALDHLMPMKDSLKIIHQTGEADYQWVCREYGEKAFDSEIARFIDDMAAAYRDADLVICRAGATTISELTACGKASVLVPYPFAANNHQEVNARVLSDRGAARMVLNGDLNGKNLAEIVMGMIADSNTLSKMGAEASRLGRPGASKAIVESCYELLGRN